MATWIGLFAYATHIATRDYFHSAALFLKSVESFRLSMLSS